MAEHEPTKQDGETQTGFAVRLIRYLTWLDGHDIACSFSLSPCDRHPNPYRDEAWSPL